MKKIIILVIGIILIAQPASSMSKVKREMRSDIKDKLETVSKLDNTKEQTKVYKKIKEKYGMESKDAINYFQRSKNRELRRRAFEIYYYIFDKNESVIKRALNDEYYIIQITALIWFGDKKDKMIAKYFDEISRKVDEKVFNEIITNLEQRHETSRNPMFYGLYLELEGQYLKLWGEKILPKMMMVIRKPEINNQAKINLLRIIERYFGRKSFVKLQKQFEEMLDEENIDQTVKEEIRYKIERIKNYKRKTKR